MRLWQRAEDDAVGVFAANLRDLLLAAPAGARATMGLDPGFRTGVKVAVVDATGKAVATETIYPHELKRRAAGGPRPSQSGAGWEASIAVLARLAAAHQVELIAIGNGTASRETDRLAADLMRAHPELKLTKVMVSEAGASVYSASEYASRELPDMDVSLRGAVSIARRLQDPLAELVKIDPKSIGVGQYQHDLSEAKLSRSLDAVVEDCVNAVGVDVNTASVPLLARVSGHQRGAGRHHRGAPGRRRAVPQPPGAHEGPAAGPEGVRAVRGIPAHHRRRRPAGRLQRAPRGLPGGPAHPGQRPALGVPELIGNTAVLRSLRPQDFTDERFGLPTVTDILGELEKPGRDPRPAFTTAAFAEGVETLEDLAPGMVLEGVGHQRRRVRRVRRHRRAPGRPRARLRDVAELRRRPARRGQVRRRRAGEGAQRRRRRKRISLTMRLDDDPGRGREERARESGKGQRRGGGDVKGKGRGGEEDKGKGPDGGDVRGNGRGGGDVRGKGRGGGDDKGRGGEEKSSQESGDSAMAEALRRAGLVK